MSAYFADTFFFLALLDRRDQHHQQVVRFASACRETLVTTLWVLSETANKLGSTPAREQAAHLLQAIEHQPGFRVIRESDELYESGLSLYAARPDKTWSLTDCISFEVMEREGLSEALTGDRHFAQAGFVAVFAGEA